MILGFFKKMGFYITIFVALTAGIGLLSYYIIGFERLWASIAQDDVGQWVGFEKLQKTSKRNQYLVCSDDICPSPSDRSAPNYDVSANQLIEHLNTIMLDQGAELIRVDKKTNTHIYRTHSPTLKFPDLTFAQARASHSSDHNSERSTLLIYAKAQLGELDFGANQKRIDHMLEILEMRLANK